MPPFLPLPDGWTVDSHAISAWRLTNDQCVIHMSGDEPRFLPGGTLPSSLNHLQSERFVECPGGWRVDPASIVAQQWDSTLQTHIFYLRDDPEEIYLPSPAPLSSSFITVPEDVAFLREQLCAVELSWDPAFYVQLYLRNGPVMLVTDEKWWNSFFLNAIAGNDSFIRLRSALWLRPEDVVALRRAYAGASKEAMDTWLLYLGRGHQIEISPSAADRFAGVSACRDGRTLDLTTSWVRTPSGERFDPAQLVASVYEAPRIETFDPRLGVYLTGGHELNFYKKEDVSFIRDFLKTQSLPSQMLLLSNDRMFRMDALVSWKNEGALWRLTLKNGPGLTAQQPEEVELIKRYVEQLSPSHSDAK